MLNVLGENYFIDFDEIEKYIDMSELEDLQKIKKEEVQKTEFLELSNNEESGLRINIIKFELVKMMLEVVLSENTEVDEKLGMKNSSNISVPFKIAFNSLLNKKLINHY